MWNTHTHTCSRIYSGMSRVHTHSPACVYDTHSAHTHTLSLSVCLSVCLSVSLSLSLSLTHTHTQTHSLLCARTHFLSGAHCSEQLPRSHPCANLHPALERADRASTHKISLCNLAWPLRPEDYSNPPASASQALTLRRVIICDS